jgi:hypothetical protein
VDTAQGGVHQRRRDGHRPLRSRSPSVQRSLDAASCAINQPARRHRSSSAR